MNIQAQAFRFTNPVVGEIPHTMAQVIYKDTQFNHLELLTSNSMWKWLCSLTLMAISGGLKTFTL